MTPNIVDINYVPQVSINANSHNFEPVSDIIKSVPHTLHIHKLTLKEVPICKLSRYIFPKFDDGPTSAGKMKIPELESLRYIVNLSCNKLHPDLKTIYDSFCGRDVSFPEISENGMLKTKYDLKAECAKFKKAQEKTNYVHNLAQTLNGPKADPENRTFEGHDNTGKLLQMAQTNISNLMTLPLSDILQRFVEKCEVENVALSQGLTKLYYLELNTFIS